VNFLMKCCIYKVINIRDNLLHKSFQFVLKFLEFILDDFKMFISTLCYDNVVDYDLLRL
jgi:hypothetical protein